MAKTSNIVTEWGQAANTSNSGYGAGANNTIGWGSVHANSSGHDRTDLVGVPSVYVGNSETVDGSGDPTGGTAQLFYRNRIEARPLWDTRQNLLTYSEDFSNADWVKGDVTVGGIAGSQTITENATNARHRIAQAVSLTNGLEYTISAKVKNNSGSRYFLMNANTALGSSVAFDIVNGTIFNTISGNGRITDLGGGEYLCEVYGTAASSTLIYLGLSDDGTDTAYLGDGSSGIILYRTQLNEGDTADEYVKTEANPYSFKGDETQLNDYSASNNGGQIYSGGALSFTTNDWVDTPIELDTNGFVLDSWVKIDGNNSLFLYSYSDSISVGFNAYVVPLSPTTLRCRFNATNFDVDISSIYQQWTHLTIAFDGDTCSVYFNGVLANSQSGLSFTAASQGMYVGRQFGATGYFEGSFAELKQYDALTASEVLQNYNNPQQPIKDGLEVWYDFNELNGLTLFDRSGNGYNATINGATWVSGVKEGFQPAQSGFNNYQTFNGSYFIDLPAPILGSATAFKITAKVSCNLAGNQAIIDTRDTANDGVTFLLDGNGNVLALINSQSFSSTFTVESGEVAELGFEWNGTQVILSKNGIEESPQACVETISTTTNAKIGRRTYSLSNQFYGIIDYVEVEGVGRWSNLGGWVDEIGSNDGSVNGSPSSARIAGAEFNSTTDVFSNTIQNAYIANALNFSGGYSGLYVDAGANVDTSGAFSFAKWLKLPSGIGTSFIYANRLSDAGISVYVVSGDSIRVQNEDGGGAVTSLTTAASTYTDNVPFFLAITRSATGQTNFYYAEKGTSPTLLGSANQSGGTPASGTTNSIFGARPTGNDLNLNGYLIYPLMYTEDLSSANTDLAPIEQIWDATKSLIPS